MTHTTKRGYIIKCDTCDQESHEINTTNRIVAQKVMTTFHHWKVYKKEDKWLRACPKCVKNYLRAGAK